MKNAHFKPHDAARHGAPQTHRRAWLPTLVIAAGCATCAVSASSAQAAGVCASGSSLASIIAQGTCSLGDLTLDFTEPHLNGYPYYPGPFAGDTKLAPAASDVLFSADTSDPDHLSFTLGLAMNSQGQGFSDFELAYIKIHSTAMRGLAGYSVAILNPFSMNMDPNSGSYAAATLNGQSSYIAADGSLAAIAGSPIDPPVFGGLMYFALSGRAYNYASSGLSSIGYGGIKIGLDLVNSVPEPASYALTMLGLIALQLHRRFKRDS